MSVDVKALEQQIRAGYNRIGTNISNAFNKIQEKFGLSVDEEKIDNLSELIDNIETDKKWFPNGTEWTISDEYMCIKEVKYANGMWVANSDNTHLYYSTDGKTWTLINVIHFTDIEYADGTWVAICPDSGSSIYYSEDGRIWTKSNVTEDMAAYPHSIQYLNGMWFAITESNGVLYSTDGKVWTQSNITDFTDTYYASNIEYANGVWVIGSAGAPWGDDGVGLYHSLDGKNWIQSNITDLEYDEYYIIKYADGTWVAAGYTGLYYSLDGKTWTQSNITIKDFHNIEYANGTWVVGRCYRGDNGLYYSTDGKTWTQSNMTKGYFNCLKYANGVWVTGGNSGVCYSLDGKEWVQSNITDETYTIEYGNGIWVMGADSGTYYSVSWEL